jgi:hypothetical protein
MEKFSLGVVSLTWPRYQMPPLIYEAVGLSVDKPVK